MKIGFIGCGNMAAAMLNGILKAGILKPEELTASAVSSATRDKIRQELKIRLAASNQDVAAFSDIIFLAVKPQYYAQVIAEIREQVRGGQIYVSIAPGKSLEWLESQFGRPVGLVRAMPNTPAMAGEGMTAYCVNAQVTAEEKRRIAQICGYFGRAEEISESLMDVVTAVSGSSPAYVFCFWKPWQMRPYWAECRGKKRIRSQRRRCLAVQKWYWKPACTRACSRIWSVPRAARPSRPCACWSKKGCAAV